MRARKCIHKTQKTRIFFAKYKRQVSGTKLIKFYELLNYESIREMSLRPLASIQKVGNLGIYFYI